jgi:hypothetical protein
MDELTIFKIFALAMGVINALLVGIIQRLRYQRRQLKQKIELIGFYAPKKKER